MALRDVQVNPADRYSSLDLEKVYGKKIKRVEGFVSGQFGKGALVFELEAIVFEDDSRASVQGEHDCPFLPVGDSADEARLKALYEEENGS